MKILSLTLKNLNSLKGKWHIDFTHPAYDDAGIFAITGQTGAGKTTILDAICLALYAKTPRIGTISKSTNEVMTRHTADCSAEVVLQLQDKFYRCTWAQRRARNLADGNLQDTQHELSEIASPEAVEGKILESKSTLTRKKIIELTGMDFQQFTRSILLAQGSFSAFLKSSASDRADILEKITGTAIYADISKRVFEKHKENEQAIKELTASLDGITLLDQNELTAKEAELKTLSAKLPNLQTQLDDTTKKITWLSDITSLTSTLSKQQQELTGAKQQQIDFQPQANRLTQALKALELESSHQKLTEIGKRLAETTEKLTKNTDSIPTTKGDLATANTALKEASSAVNIAKITLEKQQPIITEVRQLDNSINTLTEQLNDTNALVSNYEKKHTTLTDKQQALEQSVEKQTVELKHLQNYLTVNSHHADLVADLETFQLTGQALRTALDSSEKQQQKTAEQQSVITNAKKQQAESDKQLKQANEQLSTLTQEQNKLKQQLAEKLAGQTLSTLHKELSDITDQKQQLQQVSHTVTQVEQLQHSLFVTKQQLSTYQQKFINQQTQLDTQNTQHKKLVATQTDKQDKVKLKQQVLKLESFIASLQDDEHCPLCGATEHPYLSDLANGSHPDYHPTHNANAELMKLEKELAQATTEVEQSTKNLQAGEKELSVISTQILENISQQHSMLAQMSEHIKNINTANITLNNKSEFVQNISTYQDLLAKLASELLAQKNQYNESTNEIGESDLETLLTLIDSHQLTAHSNKISTLLNRLIEQNNKENHSQKQRLDRINDISKHQTNINSELETSKQHTASIEKTVSEFTQKITLAEQTLASISEQKSDTRKQLLSHTKTLANLLTKYKTDTPNLLTDITQENQLFDKEENEDLLAQLINIYKTWETQKNDFIAKQNTQKDVEKQITVLTTEQTETNNQLTETTKQRKESQDKQKQQNNSLQEQTQQRHTLFADKDPNQEETRLHEQVKEKEKSHSNAKTQVEKLQHSLDTLEKEQETLTAEKTQLAQEHTVNSKAFNQQLTEHGFTTQAEFLQASVTLEEREQLQSQQNQINQNVARITTLVSNTEENLEQKTQLALTNEDNSSLTTLQNELASTLKNHSRQIGALQQQLQDNEEKTKQLADKKQQIQEQYAKNTVWEQLYKLIGAKDGKKFRNFAQGLTFDFMIRGANAQLQKMSDRYLLVRDQAEPLELNVIDNYQAGEVRSSKNLSGGESFIISLALALGLSSMASQNIQVNSLFLDEGFGTLDEDSLDIALDTLTSLQQEGKLIGIISHVQPLKDRIHTQINVEKLSGGVSKLSGAGCSKVAAHGLI